jgi:hypothetical protein
VQLLLPTEGLSVVVQSDAARPATREGLRGGRQRRISDLTVTDVNSCVLIFSYFLLQDFLNFFLHSDLESLN